MFFFALWIERPIQLPRTIAIDFDILNFQEHGTGESAFIGDNRGGKGPDITKNVNLEKSIHRQIDPRTDSSTSVLESPTKSNVVSDGRAGVVSDTDSYVEISGKADSLTGDGEKGLGVVNTGKGGHAFTGGEYDDGDRRTIRYGSGSSNERTFRYIREGIMKNVTYPEKARRKGFMGKTLLSFTVSESGFTRDVKVINSSGFNELDSSAKEAVLRTTFSHKIPYRLFVILPIEFRLE